MTRCLKGPLPLYLLHVVDDQLVLLDQRVNLDGEFIFPGDGPLLPLKLSV